VQQGESPCVPSTYVMAEAMRSIAHPSAIHDKHPHCTGDRGLALALHLMRDEKRSLDSGSKKKRDVDTVPSLNVLIPDAWLGPRLSQLRDDRSRVAGMTEILESASQSTHGRHGRGDAKHRVTVGHAAKHPHGTNDCGPTRALHLKREEERSLDSGAGLQRCVDTVSSLNVLIPDAWLGPGRRPDDVYRTPSARRRRAL
jgi:hypothetical protein